MLFEPEKYPEMWRAGERTIAGSNLSTYQRWLRENRALNLETYRDMWAWSVKNPADFWGSLWDYFDIQADTIYDAVLSEDPMPYTDWFQGARLNIVSHIFRHRTPDKPALLYASEYDPEGVVHSWSWEELERKVIAVQRCMKEAGIGQGDRVAAYLPNCPEATVIYLAAAGLGAVWSCCSPDFGVKTVLERFTQIDPVILFAVNESHYGGKTFSKTTEIEAIRTGLGGLRCAVWIDLTDRYGHGGAADLRTGPGTLEGSHRERTPSGWTPVKETPSGWTLWNDIISSSTEASLEIVPVPAGHPIWILYSSGTTGKPKPITHSHAGILLEHLKYLHLQNDVKPGEIFFWYTTTGWMMWNFLQGAMLAGAIPFLYDGAPAWPNFYRLWAYADSLPIHHFGTSAPWILASAREGVKPGKKFKFQALRSIGSTGAPLPAEGFDWVYNEVKRDVWLCSMSGGTDVCTAFAGGCIWEPVQRALIQQRALGCDLAALDELGRAVVDELGELTVGTPMPSMPVYFWGDTSGERYMDSYFRKFPGVWNHGDWVRLFENGSLMIQGRSDATLNRGGVRIGTAEIYSITESHPSVADSLMVYLEEDGEHGSGGLFLFVVQRDSEGSVSHGSTLEKELRKILREQGSPRHIPDRIYFVEDIPYTLSGKKMEVPVKKILKGESVDAVLNKDAVRNPASIKEFVRFYEQYLKPDTIKPNNIKP